MDDTTFSEESILGQVPGDGRSHADPESLARFKAASDRLRQAIAASGDDPDRLGQHFAAITAETFGGLCTVALLNQHNELMHIAGLHDTDPRALSLVQKMVAATADLPRRNRDDGASARRTAEADARVRRRVPPRCR